MTTSHVSRSTPGKTMAIEMFAAPCMTTATMTLKRAPSTTTPIAIARGTTHDANCRKNKGPSGPYNARCQKVQTIPVISPATARPILFR